MGSLYPKQRPPVWKCVKLSQVTKHFYDGLFSIPFLLLLSVPGAIYLFRVEFDEWMYRDSGGTLHVLSALAARSAGFVCSERVSWF
jgi:hypothetical protein